MAAGNLVVCIHSQAVDEFFSSRSSQKQDMKAINLVGQRFNLTKLSLKLRACIFNT